MHHWLSLFLLFPTLFLQSCIFEGEEEVWIEADGSGKIRIQYTFPSVVLKSLGNPEDYIQAIREVDEKEESLKIESLVFEDVGKPSLFGGKSRFLLEAEFEDILNFFEIAERNEEDFIFHTGADPDQLDSIAGDIDLDMNFPSPRVQRTVSLENLLPKSMTKFPNALGKSSFSYIFHLPFSIEESNAHHISDDGKTAQWKFLLKEHVKTPMIMKMQTTIPLPWWAKLILVVLALIMIKILLKLIRRK